MLDEILEYNFNTKKYKNIAGIYCITNIISNKIYIGSSNNIYNRINRHKSSLKKNNHYNKLWIVVLCIIPIMVGYSRIEIGCHNLVQVIVGGMIGGIFGYIIYKIKYKISI